MFTCKNLGRPSLAIRRSLHRFRQVNTNADQCIMTSASCARSNCLHASMPEHACLNASQLPHRCRLGGEHRASAEAPANRPAPSAAARSPLAQRTGPVCTVHDSEPEAGQGHARSKLCSDAGVVFRVRSNCAMEEQAPPPSHDATYQACDALTVCSKTCAHVRMH